MRRILFALIVLLLASCASMPPKQKAVLSLQAVHTVLSQAQDLERGLYASKTVPALTPQEHEKFSRVFLNAFTAEEVAATALQTWVASQPLPASLNTLLAEVNLGLNTAEALTVTDVGEVGRLRQMLRDAVARVGSIFTTLRGTP